MQDDASRETSIRWGWILGALENYLSDVRDVRLSGEGVSELSYYPALRNLLEEVGGGLKPKVRCFMNLKNHGAGLPDGGLFTSDQVRGTRGAKAAAADGRPVLSEVDLGVLGGQKPARGAIEVKPPGGDVRVIAASAQVLGYLEAYRQVLVTTLREFLLLGIDEQGRPTTLERYSFAPTEAEFWALANHPRRAEQEQGARFLEFLKRVLLSGATLASPQDLAWFLASYAREARMLTESAELPALDAVRQSLEDTLGVKFEGAKGEHFFRSTLVQTLFYGLFASWVMWSHDHEPGDGDAPGAHGQSGARFDWKTAAWTLRVPVVQALFTQIATPHLLGSLGLVPVLDLAAAALNRVDRRAFFSRFEKHHAVQYFYEPFLEAFDPALRKELGVWYTPPEIVEYMVARVDTVLREELDVPDGLADPRVYVLDPCCGTGAYLVEVLERISQTLDEKGADALMAGEVKKAAMNRVFGFEILPAPFVIAHMQLGLLLQNMHLPLEENERVGVFLTNALTGWESPHGHQQVLALPELEQERDAAEKVKQELPILVVLGNPPYNSFAGVSSQEEGGLVEPYKEGLIKEWGIKKFNLDDLYVRFLRIAERRIAEMTGRGVVCFISNFSYLADPSFVVMRERLLRSFDQIWVDCLNGDSRETGKTTPEGDPDPSVFSTDRNREGIRVGTSIVLMSKTSQDETLAAVRHREYWGKDKRQLLLDSLKPDLGNRVYYPVAPDRINRYAFRPTSGRVDYIGWPHVNELFTSAPVLGMMEKRHGALFDTDRAGLKERLRTYFDPSIPWEELQASGAGLALDAAGFDAQQCRTRILRNDVFDEGQIKRYVFRPFDLRWCYYGSASVLWNRHRPDLALLRREGSDFVVTRAATSQRDEGNPFYFTRQLYDDHLIVPDAFGFATQQVAPESRARSRGGQTTLLAPQDGVGLCAQSPEPNCPALSYLGAIDVALLASDADVMAYHVLAIGYSPDYLSDNRDAFKRDWPRIPLPDSKELLLASAELGRKVADLLDPETEVDGVTGGNLRPELKVMGVPMRIDGRPLNEKTGDLAVTAGWGHAGQGGVTMPGKGKTVTRPWTSEELVAIGQGSEALGLSTEEALAQLGDQAVDVYLNDVAYWRGVPSGVWSYTIGGYQVMKKWLSYREKPLLGRDLKVEEVREVTRMARRIAAILLLQPQLDASYLAVRGATWEWKAPTNGT